MSGWGQTRKDPRSHGTPGLPSEPDIVRPRAQVRFVPPIRDLCTVAKQHLYSITSSAWPSNVAGISMPRALAVLTGVGNRVLNYREFSFGPNCAVRFNCQRVVQRGQASYVVAVMAPSDFAQL